MWRFVLTVTFLCWGSDGAVRCKNENGADVDWYILYKAPKLTNEVFAGLEYIYIDSREARNMKSTTLNFKSIKDPKGVLANTLRPIFTDTSSMPSNFGFISYSDQPPVGSTSSASQDYGHSKGVVMMEKSNGGTGVWLVHSTPKFPSERDEDNFWPDTGILYAQTFICVTFPYDEFEKIGLHLQEIRAFPFDHHIPVDFHQELKDARDKVRSPPQNELIQLMSTDSNQRFYSIAKQQSAQPEDGDLYINIAKQIGHHVQVQTWGRQDGREGSYCGADFHVFNVESISNQLGDWNSGNDHSKWCVAQDQNTHFTCIADVNRATSQYKRGGGALCTENERVHSMFLRFSSGIEDCNP